MSINRDEQGWISGLRETVREPMFAILLSCAVAYLLLGNPMEALLLGAFVLLLSLMTLWQSVRTGRALRALQDLQVPLARIRTPHGTRTLAASRVNPGDVLILSPGDRIAADARLIDGQLMVDESLLTGESQTLAKYPDVRVLDWQLGVAKGDADSVSSVFAGTHVMSGQASACVTATGSETRAAHIDTAVREVQRRPSVLQASSRRLVRTLGWLALVLCVAQLSISLLWRQEPLLHALLESLTLGMAALPEEVPVIMTVFMAMGAWRMSRSQVLTRRLSAIEVLGSVTCVAIDKTGTLTENRMRLVAAQAVDAVYGSSDLDPLSLPSGERRSPVVPEGLARLLGTARAAVAPQSTDPIDLCLPTLSVDAATPVAHLPMQPAWPVISMVYAKPGGGAVLACKGAPECVLSLCALTDVQRSEWQGRLEAMAARGWRVLAVASGEGPSIAALQTVDDAWPLARQVVTWRMQGFVAFHDPVRPSVKHALSALQLAGVRTLMLTGDHPSTAQAVARLVGLARNNSVLTGHQVAALTDELLTQQLRTTDVCARLTPQQKLRIIACLQADGQVVAMTGDGVNDAPALKAADVGVAMGRRACDLARETADIVLLDDDIGHMVSAIGQGRQIFDKMQRTTVFIVAAHVPLLLCVIVPGFMNWTVLLMPAHVVLFEMLINPACSIVFEASPPDRTVMQRPPLPVGTTPFGWHSVRAGLLRGTGLSVLMLAGLLSLWWRGENDVQQRVYLFILLAVFMLQIGLYSQSKLAGGRPSLPWWWLAGLTGALVTVCVSVPWLAGLLLLEWPDKPAAGALLLTGLASGLYLRIVQATSR